MIFKLNFLYQIMNFFVYLLQCKDSSYYCGWTNNIEKRIKAHNAGTASKYTNSRRPVKLVYFEKAKNLPSALQREFQIKQLTRKQKEILVNKFRKSIFRERDLNRTVQCKL
jgi:putative endonuclease